MFPTTTGRVAESTAETVGERIRRQTEANVVHFAHHPDRIDERLEALDREWDVERVLEANAASLALAGVVLGATVDRRFLILPAAVTAFLLQHALQGWCPPLPVLRRLGVRTASEIAEERYALKHLRGDFGGGPTGEASPTRRALHAIAAIGR
jgi:hypothetical protein